MLKLGGKGWFYWVLTVFLMVFLPRIILSQGFGYDEFSSQRRFVKKKLQSKNFDLKSKNRLLCTIKYINKQKLFQDLEKLTLVEQIISHDISKHILVCKLTYSEMRSISEHFEDFDFRISGPKVESFIKDFDSSINAIWPAKKQFGKYFNYDGLISLKENDVDPADIDLVGRTFTSNLSSGKIQAHAADMATIIAGKGNTFHSSRGIVVKASISTTSFLNLFPDGDEYFTGNNISIQNHSYGLEVEDYYGIEAQAYDEQVYEMPNVIHVFSSGNRGGENALFSSYADLGAYSNLSGTFKHAKNVLTIGGVESTGELSPGSSIGPAHDGRIKPELVAYGFNGTSESAAIASGCAAVLSNALLIEGFAPSADAIKAILVAGSDDLGSIGPDFNTGFGKINFLKSLTIVNEKEIIQGVIGSAEQFEFTIPESNSGVFAIALSWLDPPAEIDNQKALINDLDLEVEDSNGTIYYPYQMKYLPSEIESQLPISMGRDSINNIELIRIEIEGDIIIRVKSAMLTTENQSFTIAYQNKCGQCFDFLNPSHGANFEGGSSIKPSFSTIGSVEIEELDYYSNLNGDPIANFETNNNVFSAWSVPDTSLVIDAVAYSSEAGIAESTFAIANIPKIKVAWQCGDSILINWDKKSFQDTFELMELVVDSFRAISATSGNFFLIDNSQVGTHIAIREKISEVHYSPRSLALNLNTVVANCFYEGFYLREIENGVSLSIELGDINFIKRISIEKLKQDIFKEITSFENITAELSYDDLQLINGTNKYRAVIYLEDGSRSYTNEISYLYVPPDEYLIFPTVLQANYGIDIIQGTFKELDFNLVNSSGQLVIEQTLYADYDYVETVNLIPGIYFYYLKEGKEIVRTGKLVIVP